MPEHLEEIFVFTIRNYFIKKKVLVFPQRTTMVLGSKNQWKEDLMVGKIRQKWKFYWNFPETRGPYHIRRRFSGISLNRAQKRDFIAMVHHGFFSAVCNWSCIPRFKHKTLYVTLTGQGERKLQTPAAENK